MKIANKYLLKMKTSNIQNKALRKKLAQEAIKTAGKFDWNTSVKMLEKYYFELASYTIKK